MTTPEARTRALCDDGPAMKDATPHPVLPTGPTADAPAAEATEPDEPMALLLEDRWSRAWAAPVPPAAAGGVRDRLLGRAARSRAEAATMHTARRRRLPAATLADGVSVQRLYAAAAERPRRAGEPEHAALLTLAPGATLAPADWPAAGAPRREWLVLDGSVGCDGELLTLRDWHQRPAGDAWPLLQAGPQGALLFVREAMPLATAAPTAAVPRRTVRDAEAGWPAFVPGIDRRVLWTDDGEAAMLYRADPGAAVPGHAHGHDEECLMVDGELFLDDVLLQAGDYQLAPAGTGHRVTETDTGVIVYAHGDLDLRFGETF